MAYFKELEFDLPSALLEQLVSLFDRMDYGESRFQTIGKTEYGILFVIYTEREPKGTIRLISARKANAREKKAYELGRISAYARVV